MANDDIVDLALFDDEEYVAELIFSARDDELWEPFLDDDLIDRTQELSRRAIRELMEEQTITVGSERQELTLTRLALADRLSVVNKTIADRNRARTATVEAMEKKWANFAFELAEVLEGTVFSPNEKHPLDVIMKSDDLTARQWLNARRAQRLEKEKKRKEKS
ncbi:hypothetical protein QEH42_gp222 [Microbacterium phage Pumpernickel]|uniref:Uncharacterized protein n=1 Tax=Microbacterium phage Pumpernickel TaxID=2885983 RepID=A0AAE8Y8P6_9CAUD|nr:hypothetical protein QEH42_gp222 [Microbacterium phage Pumpernickel]UDL15996.1 hypothetical protein SEA_PUMPERNICKEL_246 [Microbacterium phage Pumpernickel]